LSEHEEIARYRLQDRIRDRERHALLRESRRTARRTSAGPRHRIATALHRLADRVEPPAPQRRTTLSLIGR
jgi:hypothetical protein